jgi:hypothetical protein
MREDQVILRAGEEGEVTMTAEQFERWMVTGEAPDAVADLIRRVEGCD